jgi:hypothetical protein
MTDECGHANGKLRAAGKRLSAWTNGDHLREASRELLAKSRDSGQAEIEGPRMPGVQDDNALGAGEESAATLGIPPSTLESKIPRASSEAIN